MINLRKRTIDRLRLSSFSGICLTRLVQKHVKCDILSYKLRTIIQDAKLGKTIVGYKDILSIFVFVLFRSFFITKAI